MIADPGDPFRVALLTVLFDRMRADPAEEARILECAREQLDLQRERGLSGKSFQDMWCRILSLPLADMREVLLGDHPAAAGARHAHMFAGCLPERELNSIRAALAGPGRPDRG